MRARVAGAATLWMALGVLGALPAQAVTCEEIDHLGTPVTVCEVAVAEEKLDLYLRDAEGRPYGSFDALEAAVGPLPFAMNAGMYHDDRRPVGHYVEDGEEAMFLVTNPGPGNFGLLPNGVLCLTADRARVIETLRFEAEEPECEDATQSGPMLVIDGALHPRFIEGGSSRNIRNGVGTSADGTVAYFAIADRPINFHDFGTLFRDRLGTPNALYFDGNVSRLHAPQLGRSDFGPAMGPIVAVTQ